MGLEDQMATNDKQDMLNKDMHKMLQSINDTYAAGVKAGKQQAFREAQDIVKNIAGDPVKPPVTPVNTKKFIVSYDSVDQTITLRVGDEVRNTHHSNVPHLKFDSVLTLVKDMFAKWNEVLGKEKGNNGR
jgi:hypothetical protein